MLRLTLRMAGPRHAIAAIEGPYGFFVESEAQTG